MLNNTGKTKQPFGQLLPRPRLLATSSVSTFSDLSSCATAGGNTCVVTSDINFTSTISITSGSTSIQSTTSKSLSGGGSTQLFDIRNSGTTVIYLVLASVSHTDSFSSFSGDLFGADAQEWVCVDLVLLFALQHLWWRMCLRIQQRRRDLHK